MAGYRQQIIYTPIIDLSKIDKSSKWIDYTYGMVQNALHKYYCTGNVKDFANSTIYEAHYNILMYKFRQKEDNQDVVAELSVKLLNKIFTNILVKGFNINPVAYRSYIDSSVKFCMIDYIRSKRKQPILQLYADPTLALISTTGDNPEDYMETLAAHTECDPEDILFIKNVDINLLALIRRALSTMFVKYGAKGLLYFVYHYYVYRNNELFKKMPDYYVDKIKIATAMVDSVFPPSQYIMVKEKKEKFNA